MASITWIILLTAILGAYASPRIGEKCRSQTDCETNRQCRDGTCQCLPGESFFEGQCVPRVGAYCEKKDDCKLSNSDCQSNKCICTDKYFNRSGRCALKKYVPEECEHWLVDCFTPNSICQGGHCVCMPQHKFENGTCNSSTIARPLFFFVALVLLGMKVLF